MKKRLIIMEDLTIPIAAAIAFIVVLQGTSEYYEFMSKEKFIELTMDEPAIPTINQSQTVAPSFERGVIPPKHLPKWRQ